MSQRNVAGGDLAGIWSRLNPDRTPGADARIELELAVGLLDTARVIVLVLDPDRRIVYVNAFFEELTGWPLAEIEGRDWLEAFIPADDSAAVQERFDGAMGGDATSGNVNPILTRDGGRRIVEWYDRTFLGTDGAAIALLAIGHDVTARVAAAEALRAANAELEARIADRTRDLRTATEVIGESRRHLRDILDSMFAYVGLFALDGTVLEVNRAPLELVGLRREDVIGTPFWETLWRYTSPAGRERAIDALARAGAGETVRGDFEIRIGARRAITVDTTFAPLVDAEGRVVRVIGSGVDVSLRKRAEERLRSIISNTPESVVILDPQRQVIDVNPAGLAMLEVDDPIRVRGTDLTSLVRPEHRDAFIGLHERVLAGTPGRLEYEIEGPSGRRRWVETDAVPFPGLTGDMLHLAVSRDVTEKRRLIEALADREARLQLLVDQIPGMLWTVDTDLRCTSSLGAGLAALGLQPNEIVGVHLHDFAGTSDPADPAIRSHHAALAGVPSSYAAVFGGRHYDVHVVPLRGPDNAIRGALGISFDITDRVAAEAATRIREEQLARSQALAHLGSWEWDLATGALSWSDETFRIFGLEPGSIDPTYDLLLQRIQPDDRATLEEAVRSALDAHETYRTRVRIIRPDGAVRTIDAQGEASYGADGSPRRMLGFVADVTERARAEAALHDSEALFRGVLDGIEELIVVLEPDFTISAGNAAVARLLRIPAVDVVLGRSAADVFPPAQWEWREHVLREAAASLQPATGEHSDAAGWRQFTIYPIVEDGVVRRFVTVSRDITALKRTADVIADREAQLARAQAIAHVGSWELDLAASELRWSAEIHRIFEIDPERFGASYEAFLDAIHPEDREPVNEAYSRSVADRTPYDIVHRLLLPDGRIKHVRERGETEYAPDGTGLRTRGTVQDVTDQVLAEQAMAEKDAAIESSQNAIALGDLAGIVTYANPALAALWGLPGPEAAVGRSAVDFWVDRAGAMEAIGSLLQGVPWAGRLVARRADGEAFVVQASTHPVRDRAGRVSSIMASFVDVTAQEQAERRLMASEALFRDTFEQNAVGMNLSSLDGRYQAVNHRFCEITGYTSAELVGRNFREITHPHDVADNDRQLALLLAGTIDTYTLEKRYLRRDGSAVWAELTVSARREGDRPVQLLGVVQDITARKAALGALRESEERYVRVVQGSNDGIWDWNLETDEDYLSPRWKAIVGYRDEELPNLASSFFGLVHPDDRDRVSAAVSAHLESGEPYDLEIRLIHRDGTPRWVRTRGEAVLDAAGRAVRMAGTVTDVTEQHEAGGRIAAQLREKDVLLREIHHRVKNNLQVISSLLYFQASTIDDPAVRASFAESRNRVEAMSLVHETLYQSADLGRVDFARYARRLADALASSSFDPARPIRIVTAVTAGPLDVARAIPCGLIASELVTNALKHAFVGRAEGTVTIGLEAVEPGRLRLSVSDDGVGIAEERLDSTGTLGLRLVRALTEQLEGSLEIRSDAGATFAVTFAAGG